MPWLDLSYKKYTLKKLDLLMKCNVGIFYWFTVCCGFYCLSNKSWPIIGSNLIKIMSQDLVITIAYMVY